MKARITTRMMVVLLASIAAFSCTTAPGSHVSKGQTIIPLNYLPALSGDYFGQLSKETRRLYHIYARLPDGDPQALPATRYPVVYLLDGDSLFPILAAEHLFLEPVAAGCPGNPAVDQGRRRLSALASA